MIDDEAQVRSVARAIDILLSLESGPLSLAKLADRSGLTKPTVHRLLATLRRGHLVIQDPASSDYMLGPGCLGIADAVLHGLVGLGTLARATLEELSITSQETVALHVPAGTQRICVAQVPSPQPVRYTSAVGAANPLHTGAMGKLLLAFSDEAERKELLARMPMSQVTDNTITDRAELERRLSRIRADGYAVSRAEQAVGVAAISAPVFAANGRIVTALSVLGPSDRLPDPVMAALCPVVIHAAREVTGSLADDGRRLGQRGGRSADERRGTHARSPGSSGPRSAR